MTHTHDQHHSDAAAAARAQREATVIGWVAGSPIPRERLDTRVRELRSGRLAGRLPAVGSKEDRQFLRWTAQVLLTEELCRVELAGLSGGSEADAARVLTQAESLHLGSINAAAWSSSPAMAALYDAVTEPTPAIAQSSGTRTWHRVTHAVAATPLEAATAPETSLGWTTLDDLPATLAAELRSRPSGTRVGPVRTGLGWHFATVTATESRPDEPTPRADADAPDPARLAAFNRWLDERRRDLVTNAPGFEHPGDPGQPDNTHRH
ncbi:[acyl-carrier-protein] S-malonyltransferase [Catenulispora sp. GP43]|uniref:peptidylprolyl isomerase n=1 Tax=Catenulispora sp. GP43 TaxID=3156263 RepID=UPI003511D01E